MSALSLAPSLVLRVGLAGALVAVLVGVWRDLPTTRMPGKRYTGTFEPLTDAEALVRDRLRRDVVALAGEIGERNTDHVIELTKAADYIDREFSKSGVSPQRLPYGVAARRCANIEVEIRGTERPNEIVVVGAHYDSAPGSPGANDNATGIAAVLEIGRQLSDFAPHRTLRLVAFANEEPPYFQTDAMGSRVYARACRARGDDIVAMLSLETLGYYAEARGSQRYPFPLGLLYPSVGNFVGFVANSGSRNLLFRAIGTFRADSSFPSEGGALNESLPGVGWSDHWSFWQSGYPALEITDTAIFRYPYYHTARDTPEKVDFDRLARVTMALTSVVEDFCQTTDRWDGRTIPESER